MQYIYLKKIKHVIDNRIKHAIYVDGEWNSVSILNNIS